MKKGDFDIYEIEDFKFKKIFKKFIVDNSKIDKQGYVWYHVSIDGKRYRWEKRYDLVFLLYKKEENKYGYNIHHKNFNKLDDRPSNLQVLTKQEHIDIHTKYFSRNGESGSKRNFGKVHSKESVNKIRNKLKECYANGCVGNANAIRNDEWKQRMSIASKRKIIDKYKHVKMRDVIKKYISGLSTRKIAKMFNVSREVISNRLHWFIEDNFNKNIDMKDIRVYVNFNNLHKFIFFDEKKSVRDSEEYKILDMRYNQGLTYITVAKKMNIDINKVKNVCDFFENFLKMKDKQIKEIHKKILRLGFYNIMVDLLKDIYNENFYNIFYVN